MLIGSQSSLHGFSIALVKITPSLNVGEDLIRPTSLLYFSLFNAESDRRLKSLPGVFCDTVMLSGKVYLILPGG